MFHFKIFFILTIFALSNAQDYQTVSVSFDDPLFNFLSKLKSPKIVNGQNAAINQFPHQAVLNIQTLFGNALCGGSLIDPSWVLSAAHCIIGAKSITVQLGSINRNSMPLQIKAIKALRLSSYNPMTLSDDISLIKLEKPVVFTENIKPILLPSATTSSADEKNILRVSGFGLTVSNQIASTLQFTDVIVISKKECGMYYGSMITDKMVCTRGYPNTNMGTCNGDSGGPLISKTNIPEQVGIVSFGSAQGCAIGAPQGFTRVSSYLTWINSVIKST